VTSDESRISEQTRPDAARELGGLQIISNRPLAVSLPRPDGFLRLVAAASDRPERKPFDLPTRHDYSDVVT
jgi:hypothetical protein